MQTALTLPTVEPAPTPVPYPLTPIQQGMLVHWLRNPDSGTDVEQIVADLDEAIDPRRLEGAWNAALEDLDTLRTAFEWDGPDGPRQDVAPYAAIGIPVVDLRTRKAPDRDAEIARYLAADRMRPFDLKSAPAMRVALFRVDESRWTMVWSVHHILLDGRSFEMVLNRVFDRYDGIVEPVVDAPAYADYAWWAEEQDRSGAREFWRRYLAGFTATTPLPFETDPAREGRFATRETRLSCDETQRLEQLADRAGVSLNTIMMAAWALLLSRHSGETDVVFGATKTTRRGSIPDADKTVGLFLATVPVRIPVAPEARVEDWLREIRRNWVSLRGNESLPLVDIRQSSALPPGAALFDSLVVFEAYQFADRLHDQGGPWDRRTFRLYEQTGYPLTFLGYGGETLGLKIEYDGHQFSAATVQRLLEQARGVLVAWGRNADTPVRNTPIVTPDEARRLMEDWNATAAPYPRDKSLARLVEEQVARSPDAIAVISGSTELTYRELNARANRLARVLIARGAAPDRLVAVCLERSPTLFVSLLAVVKARAAYLPLDPSLPADRLAFMISDSAATVLVTDRENAGSFDETPISTVLADDVPWDEPSPDDEMNLDLPVAPEHLAYVIYTSGSTGRPKGVQVSRGSLLNLLWSVRSLLEFSSADRVLGVTTISFDIAGVDVWLPWLVGAQCILADQADITDGARLQALMAAHDVTFLQATPVTWKLLLGTGWPGASNLQAVCTGEAMPEDLAAQLRPLVGRLWNLYGPTETTVWSTGHRVTESDGRVVIGRPIANTQCYVLDDALCPAPIGACGELYIGGDGLARGYLNRPDLTRERFVPSPFRAGERLYRTGDVARFRANGDIECLGRTDHQVKIRGFRIEPGEIEAVLKRHEGVQDAVVVAREDGRGDKRLVAYVVPGAKAPDASELRGFAKQTLPEYMLPAVIVRLDAMPLSSNGKVDRKALPAPTALDHGAERAPVRPRTYVEKQLSEIWEDLFELPEVSVEDDFFELGGHSLLALAMMTRISQVFGRDLPLNTLFESASIATLATHLERDQQKVGYHTLVSIQAAGSRPPIFWIPGGAALGLFRLRHVVTRLGPDQPVYGLGSAPPRSLDEVESVEERAAHYLELVRRRQPHGPYCLAGFCAGGLVAFEMAQQLAAAGETVAFLGLINSWFPNYPSGRIRQTAMRAQRLRHKVRTALARGDSLRQLAAARRAGRAASAARERELDAARESVSANGFERGDRVQNDLLLEATTARFRRYVPRAYPGRVSLFISDDANAAGLSRNLDPRFAWTRVAGSHEVRVFPGGHEAVLEPPYAVHFAETLGAALEEAVDSDAHG